MKKILLTLPFLILLTGCGNNGKIQEKSYLRALSVDKQSVTFSFFSEDDENISIESENLCEAKKKAELCSGKEIFTGYTEIIIIENNTPTETLSFLFHDWKVSPSCMVVKAQENGGKLLDEVSAERLEGEVRTAQKLGKAPKCDIITVLGSLLNDKKTALTAVLSGSGFIGTSNI